MPSLAQHPSQKIVKMLMIGDSGSGKTGSLVSLAKAGYNLRIVDYDNGLDILKNLLADDPEASARVTYETFTDKIKLVMGKPVVDGVPMAFQKSMELLTHWKMPERTGPNGEKYEAYDLGKITSWTEKDVLVLDSLSLACEAALRHILALNGRPGAAQLQDWGQMAQMIEGLVQLLYSSQVPCNVIVMTHIKTVGDENELKRGLPFALGQKLPVIIGRYFNSILMVRSTGTGSATKRSIVTRPEGFVELKNSFPTKVPPTLPLETGLNTFFDIMRTGVAK